MELAGSVVAVAKDDAHRFSKAPVNEIRIIAGLGVEGDAHAGTTVKHRSRVARTPQAPNLRQVHLIQQELLLEAPEYGFNVTSGELGENITTSGIDLPGLPEGTRLYIGEEAIIRVTGLRTPCSQIDRLQRGLLKHLVARHPDGTRVREVGVMAVAEAGGLVYPGDTIRVELPAGERLPLKPV